MRFGDQTSLSTNSHVNRVLQLSENAYDAKYANFVYARAIGH